MAILSANATAQMPHAEIYMAVEIKFLSGKDTRASRYYYVLRANV